MSQIYKHVTIEFAIEQYCVDKKKDKDIMYVPMLKKFFNNVPAIKYSSGSVVCMQDLEPRCHYMDIPQSNLNETIEFINSSRIYKKYVHIRLRFY